MFFSLLIYGLYHFESKGFMIGKRQVGSTVFAKKVLSPPRIPVFALVYISPHNNMAERENCTHDRHLVCARNELR